MKLHVKFEYYEIREIQSHSLFKRHKRSLKYYTEVLDFDDSWEWGDPTDFGGIVKDDVEIFFCLNGQGSPGTWIAIIVDDVDNYYKIIKDRGAKIISPPAEKEWNMREMFVEDPDGHMIRFGQRIDCD